MLYRLHQNSPHYKSIQRTLGDQARLVTACGIVNLVALKRFRNIQASLPGSTVGRRYHPVTVPASEPLYTHYIARVQAACGNTPITLYQDPVTALRLSAPSIDGILATNEQLGANLYCGAEKQSTPSPNFLSRLLLICDVIVATTPAATASIEVPTVDYIRPIYIVQVEAITGVLSEGFSCLYQQFGGTPISLQLPPHVASIGPLTELQDTRKVDPIAVYEFDLNTHELMKTRFEMPLRETCQTNLPQAAQLTNREEQWGYVGFEASRIPEVFNSDAEFLTLHKNIRDVVLQDNTQLQALVAFRVKPVDSDRKTIRAPTIHSVPRYVFILEFGKRQRLLRVENYIEEMYARESCLWVDRALSKGTITTGGVLCVFAMWQIAWLAFVYFNVRATLGWFIWMLLIFTGVALLPLSIVLHIPIRKRPEYPGDKYSLEWTADELRCPCRLPTPYVVFACAAISGVINTLLVVCTAVILLVPHLDPITVMWHEPYAPTAYNATLHTTLFDLKPNKHQAIVHFPLTDFQLDFEKTTLIQHNEKTYCTVPIVNIVNDPTSYCVPYFAYYACNNTRDRPLQRFTNAIRGVLMDKDTIQTVLFTNRPQAVNWQCFHEDLTVTLQLKTMTDFSTLWFEPTVYAVDKNRDDTFGYLHQQMGDLRHIINTTNTTVRNSDAMVTLSVPAGVNSPFVEVRVQLTANRESAPLGWSTPYQVDRPPALFSELLDRIDQNIAKHYQWDWTATLTLDLAAQPVFVDLDNDGRGKKGQMVVYGTILGVFVLLGVVGVLMCACGFARRAIGR